jgi:hypothetical protein
LQEHFAVVEQMQASHRAEIEELRISADAAMREAEGRTLAEMAELRVSVDAAMREAEGRALDAVARKEREMEGKV